jgi:hypothetical protein
MSPEPEKLGALRAHHLLALLPAAGIVAGVAFANRTRPHVLGLPFLLFWIVGCVLLTSVVMALLGARDAWRSRGPARERDHGPRPPR